MLRRREPLIRLALLVCKDKFLVPPRASVACPLIYCRSQSCSEVPFSRTYAKVYLEINVNFRRKTK